MKGHRSVIASFLVVLLTGTGKNALAQVWQWSVPVKGEKGPARAFLWVPEDCKTVRGVVLAQHNMEEISILQDAAFRKTMADIGFAEVWVSPFFDHLFNFKQGAGETFNSFMDSLAFVSGYEELRYAPVVGMGHSAAASWPYYFAAWNPERTLACVSVSGQWPYFRNSQFAPDIWNKEQNIDYVPSLETMGEFEAAETWSAEGLKERQNHPLMPLSMLAVPGEGHFATSDKKTTFIAFWIKKAAQYRLPLQWDGHAPPSLRSIDPTKTGWLGDKWRLNQHPFTPAAPVGKYTGDPSQAFWYFDEETVQKVEAYGAKHRGLRPQLVGLVQEGKMVPQKNTHLQIDLKFLPLADGRTFNLQTAFYDTVPGGSPRPKSWTGLEVGTSISHVKDGVIKVEKVAGPFKKIGFNSFALNLERGLEQNPKSYVLTFVATQSGNNEFKPAVQQAQMIIPAKIEEGEDQKILFPTLPDQKKGVKKIPLKAVSTVGVPVSYYVLEGPAEVEGAVLRFTKIPSGARYPVKVTVVAWQYGLRGTRKLKTAEPVVQTFLIYKQMK